MAAQTFPIDTIAKLLDLTPRRVNQLVNEGVIPRAERGRYELVPAVQGYIRYLKTKAINADVSTEDSEHKRRLLKARADIAEMEAERLSGDLVEAASVQKTWIDLMALVRARMLALPAETAELVASETTIDACHEIIETHVHATLAELAAAAVDGAAEADDLGMVGQASALEQ